MLQTVDFEKEEKSIDIQLIIHSFVHKNSHLDKDERYAHLDALQ